MRTPGEYVAAALRGLRATALAGNSATLAHAGRAATVTRVGALARGDDPLGGEDVNEGARVLALAADFPGIARGEPVELDGSLHLVTSARLDAAGATLSVGLSQAFDRVPAAYSGTRRESGRVRKIRHPLDVLLLESGTADAYSGGPAPSYAAAYTAAVRAEDWPEATDPEPSDALDAAPGGRPVSLKVSAVTRHGGWYIFKCRTRG